MVPIMQFLLFLLLPYCTRHFPSTSWYLNAVPRVSGKLQPS